MSRVQPRMATAFSTVGFFALLIASFGIGSLLLDVDVIATPGVGVLAGVLAAGAAIGAFLLVLWRGTAVARPTYRVSGVAVVATVAAYLAGLWIGAVVQGADVGLASAAVGGFVTSWFVLVLAVCAFVAAWAGIALVRTRAQRPRWRWENRDD
ncbi:hypothetical protein [Microbacterium sp. No. 7]|uniref:hypothetical protein n=1 Tax=Microbacterium sp. No. 7 TaxID=1714373 RepID=UPI0006D0F25C|nr:hypothetical protein [Microbacterium sp. No. 7]ALJ18985.1 hypothetical protein AOA12_03305 [Microbacterium sp. No. 7]